MLFTTLPYALFFAAVFVGHWGLPRPLRRLWLLIASYVFYMQAIPQYALLIGAMTLTNYGFGLALGIRPRHNDAIKEQRADETPRAVGTTGTIPADRGLGSTEHSVLSVKTSVPSVISPRLVPFQNLVSFVARPPFRKGVLIFAISANLATLAFFKYAAFALDSVWPLVHWWGNAAPEPVVAILLPLGISFFTFEFIHYVVEVYHGQPPMRNLIDFALFAAFFPTQIAGPIKRFPVWVRQAQHPLRLREVRADDGLSLIVRGMAKKIIIADTLAPLVGVAFGHPDHLGFLAAWCAIYAFAAQIYADFSGYTDIGRGCALLLGYSVPENFAAPYAARSPSEFWDRWHISLSRWLRDYVYIPLGGSRRPLPRICLNLLITMALGGLWHGASWHFMLWGGYQGLLLIGQRLLAPHQGEVQRRRGSIILGQIATFHLVCIGWVLFRAETPDAVGNLLLAAFTPWRDFAGGFTLVPASALGLPALVLATCAALVVWGWRGNDRSDAKPAQAGFVTVVSHTRWSAALFLNALRPVAIIALLVLVCIWPQGAAQRFIYFQF